jgi:predicted kinase
MSGTSPKIFNPTSTVIVGIGIPGCGKTTYLKPLSKEYGMAYVNPDEIRQEITGNAADHSREIEVWKRVHSSVAKSITRGVVVDATYTKKRDRRELIQLCQQAGATEIIAYWFDVPIEICRARNKSRERVVPELALLKMHDRLTINPPTLEEGFTEIKTIRP